MRIYLIRHADPDYARDSLTPLGHRQADALAQRLDNVRLDAIYGSPLGRAQLTASYTARRKRMPIQTLPWTSEPSHWHIDPPADTGDRCVSWNIDGHRVRVATPLPTVDDWHRWSPLDDPQLKQDYDEIVHRSDVLFASRGYTRDGHLYHVIDHSDAQLAVFCHAGVGLAWLAHLLALPLPLVWIGFFLAPSSVTTILMDERCDGVATPRCLGWANPAISSPPACATTSRPRASSRGIITDGSVWTT